MPRKLTPNRWNWSQKDEKWIFIEINDQGEEKYYYKLEPPEEFISLTMQLKELNEKLIITKDVGENTKIFNEMVRISKRLQCMPRNDI
ncbi:MAG: hypothetical protein EU532_03515 [Promethearchaeota archaeon]|nr:MAG: hypothetical protein EU532_03515 [Candidatus Lokiarchaeota archaeon]